MKNFYYEGERFKNGNCNLRFSPDEIEKVKCGRVSEIEMLSAKMDALDLLFFGEDFCIRNDNTGHMLYSAYSDMVFVLAYSSIDDYLMRGKTLKLYARRPNAEERAIIDGGDF